MKSGGKGSKVIELSQPSYRRVQKCPHFAECAELNIAPVPVELNPLRPPLTPFGLLGPQYGSQRRAERRLAGGSSQLGALAPGVPIATPATGPVTSTPDT